MFLGSGVHLAGFIDIGERCFTERDSVVIDSVSIESRIQTGGGTVVIKDCADGSLLVVNSAREVRKA